MMDDERNEMVDDEMVDDFISLITYHLIFYHLSFDLSGRWLTIEKGRLKRWLICLKRKVKRERKREMVLMIDDDILIT